MQETIRTATTILTDRIPDGETPLSLLKDRQSCKRLVQRLNIVLKRATTDRGEKLRLLQAVFDLQDTPATSYELTVGQASALVALAYLHGQDINQNLIDYLKERMDA